MISKEIFDQINEIKEESIEGIFYAVVEEVGELGLALHVEKGTKQRKLTESSKVECVDSILCLVELFCKLGGTLDEMNEIGIHKLNKWANNVRRMSEFTSS